MGYRNFFRQGKKIVAVGKNFKCHAKETNSAIPTEPVLFLKPTSSYVLQPGPILIPRGVEADHEVEFGVVIGKPGSNIKVETAMDYVGGYTVALDITARNLQRDAKASGMPWTISKGFDTFTPLGHYIPKPFCPRPHDLNIWCKVNGVMRQHAFLGDMIFPIPELISYISSIMRLEANDLILTGTPAGVGPIVPGDVVFAGVSGDITTLKFRVATRPETLRQFNKH